MLTEEIIIATYLAQTRRLLSQSNQAVEQSKTLLNGRQALVGPCSIKEMDLSRFAPVVDAELAMVQQIWRS